MQVIKVENIAVKVRFCPSPTGHIHLGNTRTALFNALITMHEHGTFLLRIEDTDATRSKVELAEDLQTDLTWLGLQWQEGPGIGGSQGPYWQSQRHAIYQEYYDRLIAQQMVYPCFCTESQLAMVRKAQRAAGKPPRYAGTCRGLSEAEVASKIAAGLKPTLRFRVPAGETMTFHDTVKGLQRFQTSDIGDFIIRRADKTASFMYCNALDDALMGVTRVVRGEDHLTNTPRQLLLLNALKLPAPTYTHIPLITGQDGSGLSKRHGSQSVRQLREAGYLALALNNYLARVGHSYADNQLYDLAELAAHFDCDKLSKSAARFDHSQLLYWQKAAVAQLTETAFWQWVGDDITQRLDSTVRERFFQTIHANVSFPGDVATWITCLQAVHLHYSAEMSAVLQQAGAAFFQVALQLAEQHSDDFSALSQGLKAATGIKGKALFQPLRLALTAHWAGPEMKAFVKLLGHERVMTRLGDVLQQVTGEPC